MNDTFDITKHQPAEVWRIDNYTNKFDQRCTWSPEFLSAWLLFGLGTDTSRQVSHVPSMVPYRATVHSV